MGAQFLRICILALGMKMPSFIIKQARVDDTVVRWLFLPDRATFIKWIVRVWSLKGSAVVHWFMIRSHCLGMILEGSAVGFWQETESSFRINILKGVLLVSSSKFRKCSPPPPKHKNKKKAFKVILNICLPKTSHLKLFNLDSFIIYWRS